MGFELPNGKTARNLQDQVKFLSEKLKDLYAAFNDSGLKKIVIVEELPEVGDPTVLYLLAKEDPEEGDYYDEYLWYDNQWELIGSTQIDLSDYCTLSTDQTISGKKTFTNDITLPSHIYMPDGGATFSCGNSDEITITKAETKFDGKVRAWSGNTFDLGDSLYTWKDLYLSGKVDFSSNASILWDSTLLKLKVGNNTAFGISTGAIYANFNMGTCKVYPQTTNTYDLGDSSHTWRDLYLNGKITFSDWWTLQYTSALYFARSGSNKVGYLSGRSQYYDYDFQFRGTSKLLGNNNDNYGLVIPDTTSWSDNKTISTVVIKQHSVVCANGTLTILTSYAQSATSGSTVSAACSVALSLKWNGYPAIYCSGTVVHYYDYADLTIKSASLGTINSDTITDY